MALTLVTGGAGFIGSNLVSALIREGHEVRVLDDLSTGRRENLATIPRSFQFHEGSILDSRVLQDTMKGVDLVFHQAAIPSVQRSVEDPLTTHRVNSEGTLRVLEAARKAGVRRLIYAGSSSAYGETEILPKVEDMPPSPVSPYAVSKLAGEHHAAVYDRLFGVETVTLRYFNVFGPNQDPASDYAAVVPRFMRAALDGRPPTVYGDGLQTRDFCYVENVVEANLAAAAAADAHGTVVNVAGGEPISLLDLLRFLSDLIGREIRPEHTLPRPGDVRHSAADLSRARRLLAWSPRIGVREGLSRTLDHFRRTS